MLAYLERAPRQDPPLSLPITCYILEGADEVFAGYAIEEVEAPVLGRYEIDFGWSKGDVTDREMEIKSVASVVVVGKTPDISVIVAGIELCQKSLAADEVEREAKKAAEAKSKEK